MGHWSESLFDEAAKRIGGSPDRQALMDLLVRVGREIDVLSGRSFHPLRQTTSVFEPNGLPFVEVPDMQVGSMEPVAGVWEVPDPVNRQIATVLQVSPLATPAPKAAPVADALWFAGQLLAEASHAGHLSGDYVLRWLGTSFDGPQRIELMRRAMDPAVRVSVPVLGVSVGGWWIQISRRLLWVTGETEDDGRLVELLLDKTLPGGERIPLAACEPILIVAPTADSSGRRNTSMVEVVYAVTEGGFGWRSAAAGGGSGGAALDAVAGASAAASGGQTGVLGPDRRGR